MIEANRLRLTFAVMISADRGSQSAYLPKIKMPKREVRMTKQKRPGALNHKAKRALPKDGEDKHRWTCSSRRNGGRKAVGNWKERK